MIASWLTLSPTVSEMLRATGCGLDPRKVVFATIAGRDISITVIVQYLWLASGPLEPPEDPLGAGIPGPGRDRSVLGILLRIMLLTPMDGSANHGRISPGRALSA